MAVTSFIPEVWSARLQENLHKELVFGALCNRSWEGEIAQWGDTVHINSLQDLTVRAYVPGQDLQDPEQLSGTDQTLVIDHGVYCNFYLSDVDAAQARADLMEAAMRGAARRLAEDTEAYLLEVIREGAGITVTAAAGAASPPSLFSGAGADPEGTGSFFAKVTVLAILRRLSSSRLIGRRLKT